MKELIVASLSILGIAYVSSEYLIQVLAPLFHTLPK